MYFSGLHHDSSPCTEHKYYGERYTVSTIYVCDHWETCVFDEIDGGSEVVWVGVGDDLTPAWIKSVHNHWVEICRSGEFKFDEDDE